MKILAISQRVENVSNYDEKRDCLDQRWAYLVRKLGFLPYPLSNLISPEEIVESINISAIILTGGNSIYRFDKDAQDSSRERDLFEERLVRIAIEKRIPVVGICRGMQIINTFFNGSISKIENHVGTRHKLNFTNKYLKERSRDVNSYHKWCIEEPGLGESLFPLALAEDGTIESFYHKELPIFGIMWHPEREVPFNQNDLNLIKGFFE